LTIRSGAGWKIVCHIRLMRWKEHPLITLKKERDGVHSFFFEEKKEKVFLKEEMGFKVHKAGGRV
jgi:hypothetical protein